jgi:YD repeat-containing protein
MNPWLQFVLVSFTASAFAHGPEGRVVAPGLALRAHDAAWNLNQRTNGAAIQTFNVDGKNQMTTVPDGSCTYDANGNLKTARGGLQLYTYDDEDRLTGFTQYASQTVPQSKTEFTYDGLSRLRVRKEYTWVPDDNGSFAPQRGRVAPLAGGGGGSGTWQLTSETRYVYDGRRVIQERDGNNTPTVTYTRGKDLSGTLEGAGGIGGLLARSHGYNGGSGGWSAHNFYHADGGGNVTYLVNSSQGLAASYRYDPYGNLLASSGPLTSANVYRFSSKELVICSRVSRVSRFQLLLLSWK